MHPDFEGLCDMLSMTEIIRLQAMLSSALVRRFERRMALCFSDIVGSTPYFARFGDEAGRQLQQRHIDLLHKAIAPAGGRIVDTAGDGAFLCFQTVDGAIASVVELQRLISAENLTHAREHQLAVRIGAHHGSVLTDGVQVTGDAVNYCSRVAATANPGEIRLTKEAFFALADARQRLRCRMLPPVSIEGIERPAELMLFQWRDQSIFPTKVRLETGQEYTLLDQDIISFGRLEEKDGNPANDIVLQCSDEHATLQISRWHFELLRRATGFVIRAVSNAPTVLNDHLLSKGEEHPLAPGDSVRVGNVLSMRFEGPLTSAGQNGGVETFIPQDPAAVLNAVGRKAPEVRPQQAEGSGKPQNDQSCD
jgi:class 3 adenylate cyclase